MKRLILSLALACAAIYAQTAAVSNVTVTFSATPTFTANAPVTNFDITLTGNVTSSTFSSPAAGVGSLRVCQDATGSRTFTAPTGSVGFGAIDSTANGCSTAQWKWDGTTLRAVSPFVKANGVVVTGGGGASIASTSNVLKGDGAGNGVAATAGTDYAPATSGASILKGNGSGGFTNATSGTDFAPPTSGTTILKGNGSGGTAAATGTDVVNRFTGTPDGTKFLRDDGTLATPPGGSASPGGSTTQVQFNNAGAFAGDSGLTYNSGTKKLTAAGGVSTGDGTTGSQMQSACYYIASAGHAAGLVLPAASAVGASSSQPVYAYVCDGASYGDTSTGGGTLQYWLSSDNTAWTYAGQVQANWTAVSGLGVILNKPTIPTASSATPLMDGVAAAGSGTAFARDDHKHPTDTSRMPATNPDLGGTALSNTVTAGTGGVTAGHIVQKTADVPVTYVNASSATAQVKGIARATATATNTFQLATSGIIGCVVEGTVTSGHYWTYGTTDPSKCKDTGQAALASISNSIRIGGVFQASGTDGQTVNVTILQNASGAQVDTVSSIGGAPTALSTTCAGTVNWGVTHSVTEVATITTTGACNLTISGMSAGGYYTVLVTQGSGGSHTLSLGTGGTGGCAAWKVGGGGSGAVTPTTTAGAVDVLAIAYDGTNCYANYRTNFN